jgi:hypothetical protein
LLDFFSNDIATGRHELVLYAVACNVRSAISPKKFPNPKRTSRAFFAHRSIILLDF